MKTRFAFMLSLALLGSPLAAQDVRSQIADQLRKQGYENVEVTKTWLGRLRFQASSDDQTREIIVNPRTGEILRDFQMSKGDTQKRDVKILDRSDTPRPSADGREPHTDRGSAPEGNGPKGSGPDGQGDRGGPSK